MGAALAARASARGAEVTLIAANLAVPAPAGVRAIEVETAAELAEASAAEFARCDMLLMAAAVADFRPSSPFAAKLKKDAGAPAPIELERTEDVLSTLSSSRRSDQVLIGFAAEHGEGAVAYGRRKLHDKGLDAIVVNDISREDIGFDVDANEVTIIAANGALGGELDVGRASKAQVAEAILDAVAKLRD
jgi:phosphopantothenoylcysteine decarboxylase/phosphopantothenate--cysteine ligase